MNSDLINSINSVAENVKHLENTFLIISRGYWWNTQWFSTIIGAVTGFIGTLIYSSLKERNKILFNFYQLLLEQAVFSDPDGLLQQALITSYQDGDKPVAEKMVIELRSPIKYWYKPLSKIRFLFMSYESSIRKIKNGTREEILKQEEYKEAKRRFQNIMDFVYKKTGENEWTS